MKKGLLCVLASLLLCMPFAVSAKTIGDVNSDGAADAKDYMKIKRYVLGTHVLTEAEQTAADINGDGRVDSKDYMILKRAVLGMYSFEEAPAEPTVPEQILALVNAERAKHGLQALTLSEELNAVATDKAVDMASRGYFDHTSPTYGTPFEMLENYGISYRAAGENIAAGQLTPEDVMDAWMSSEGHRANILSSAFNKLGVGFAYGGEYGIYWTQLFVGSD